LTTISQATLSAGALASFPAFAAQESLRIGYFDKFEPLSFRAENGAMEGLLVKAVSLVSGEAGFSPRHFGYPWARAQKLVQMGELDAFCTNLTDTRREYVLFCDNPLVVNRSGALHRKGDTRFRDFQKKADMKGIVLVDYLGNKWIEAELGGVVTFNWVSSQVQVFKMVARGRSDAVVVSEIEGRHLLRTHGLAGDMEFSALPFMPPDHYTIGVRRSMNGLDDVVSRLNAATLRVRDNGRLASIISGYLS
jgi:polar amino acid transport system substrate-binding protein